MTTVMFLSPVAWLFLCFGFSSFVSMQNQGIARGFLVSIMPDFTGAGQLAYFSSRPEDLIFATINVVPEYFYVANITNIVSLAVDPSRDKIYAFDLFSHTLYELDGVNSFENNTLSTVHVLHEGISETTSQIAFDWLSKNIYWTDQVYNWIVMQHVDTNDRSMYKIIVDGRLNAPIAIEVDPLNGFLFWSELGNKSYIVRSLLTGEIKKMIFAGLSLVTDMVADPLDQRLYWLDVGRSTLESGSYNGTDRRVIRRSMSFLSHMTGLTLYRNLICVSIQSSFMVECLVKHTGEVIWSYTFELKDGRQTLFKMPWAMQSYDPDFNLARQNLCESYGCSHLCVDTPSKPVCLCKEGYVIEADGKNCTRKHELYDQAIVLANGTSICMLDVRIITGYKKQPICVLDWGHNISYIDVDSYNQVIYFADEENKKLIMFDIVSNSTTVIAKTSEVSGLVYDWINSNLCWSEQDTGLIKCMTKFMTVQLMWEIFENLQKPKSITINPLNTTLYWISGQNGLYSIEAGTFNGKERWIVVDFRKLRNPSGLFFDCLQYSLFWIDEGLVYSTEPGTDNINIHFPAGDRRKLIKYKGYILAADETGTIATATSSSQEVSNILDFPSFNNIRDLAVYDTAQQLLERGPCDDNNGGCEQICIPSEQSFVCRCGLGYILEADQQHCKSDAPLDNNFALISDFTHGTIYQISLDNKKITAVDIPVSIQPTYVIYDSNEKFIYWSDAGMKQINRINSDGTNMLTLLNTGFYEPHGIEIDSSTGNMYYSAVEPAVGSYIGVVNPTTIQTKLIVEGLTSVYNIALFPQRGLLFWTDSIFLSPHLGRSTMDGRDVVTLVKKNIVRPSGLAIDYVAERVYWTDSELHTIRSCDIEGFNIIIHMLDKNASPAQLALYGSYIYYTSINKQKITKLSKMDGTIEPWMNDVPELGRLESLTLYPGDVMPVNPFCSQSNGKCSTFCLPMPIGRVCACDDGIELMEDKRTCSGVPRCDEPIPNGKLDSDCSGYEGAICDFICEEGYRRIENITNVKCTVAGKWNESVVNLCLQPSSTDPKEDTINSSVVAGGIFASVIAAIIALSMIIVTLCRRDIIPVFKANRTPSIRFVQDAPSLNHSITSCSKLPSPSEEDSNSITVQSDPPSQTV